MHIFISGARKPAKFQENRMRLLGGVSDTSFLYGDSNFERTVKHDPIEISKPHAHLHTRERKPAEFQENWIWRQGGVADTKFEMGGHTDSCIDGWKVEVISTIPPPPTSGDKKPHAHLIMTTIC